MFDEHQAVPRARAASVVAIGAEVTEGRTVNTNASWISLRLRELGLETASHLAVPDAMALMDAALREAARHARYVFVSGGLGPTRDDLTREAAAALADRELIEDLDAVAHIQEIFARIGRDPGENNRRQAMIPAGAERLDNPIGTAPGFCLEALDAVFFFLPGVPREMKRMLREQVEPRLRDRLGAGVRCESLRLNCFGVPESRADELLTPRFVDRPVRLSFNVSDGILEVHLTADTTHGDAAAADAIAAGRMAVYEALGRDRVFGEGSRSLAAALIARAEAAGQTLAFAESCTGGLAAHLVTQAPGASAVLRGGVVAYANEVKRRVLGVSKALLSQHGAVSEACARAMAEGARAALGADLAASITGIAGPGGASDDKPVGLVWIAVAWGTPDGVETYARRLQFGGERTWIQRFAALAALELMRRTLGRLAEARRGSALIDHPDEAAP